MLKAETHPPLDNVRIVLVEPQVPGNVGAVARAMKNMGLSSLHLVRPWFRDHPQARYMAHGSEDILDGARVTDTLEEAVGDAVLVAGTTRRRRHNVPFVGPRRAAEDLVTAARNGQVALLFGREDKGLSNEELCICRLLITIPSSERQPSLNLSQAVMVMAWELFTALVPECEQRLNPAPASVLEEMYGHLEAALVLLGFRQWNDGDNYMKSLRRVFSRTGLERRDVAVVHKLCGEIEKYTARLRAEFEAGERS